MPTLLKYRQGLLTYDMLAERLYALHVATHIIESFSRGQANQSAHVPSNCCSWQVRLLPRLYSWLQQQNITGRDKAELKGRLDLSRLATVGHSRGGKLAALHFAGLAPLNDFISI